MSTILISYHEYQAWEEKYNFNSCISLAHNPPAKEPNEWNSEKIWKRANKYTIGMRLIILRMCDSDTRSLFIRNSTQQHLVRLHSTEQSKNQSNHINNCNVIIDRSFFLTIISQLPPFTGPIRILNSSIHHAQPSTGDICIACLSPSSV